MRGPDSASVDLICLDPLLNSNQNFTAPGAASRPITWAGAASPERAHAVRAAGG